MYRLLWTAEYDPEWEATFQKNFEVKRAGFNIHNTHYNYLSEDELIEALEGIDIFFVGYDKITERVLKSSPDLKLILSVRDGPEENIDLSACKAFGIPVLNSAGRCTMSVSELTFNLIMNMARPTIMLNNIMRGEGWTKDNALKLRSTVETYSFELYRKTLGIVGLGRNGQRLAEYGLAFGMQVVAYDPFVDAEAMLAKNIRMMELDDVLRESDYISILARVTEENQNMIGAEQFNLMKPTAGFVNTGRAALVDTEALKNALNTDQIRIAAIDVFKPEPLGPNDTYYDIPQHKLIMTSHGAGFTNERVWHQYNIGMDNLEKFLNGEALQNNYTRGVEDTEAYRERGAKLFGAWK
ncbi:D-3-phosphoglycerate dehydrogenase [Eubacteriales bacterium OttesenSCG-928-N14]|nr:D-3-phosphoglycerate dehydrogenase [Eubacteriales bacterium OttesenSCG-928-N14]